MRGVKTTGQNRSYAKVYGPRERNAACIQRLLDMGVEIVGKVKGTQFASGEQPTADWIEYSCPWNPRGDGYLSPRGSSTGSGVAIAGYEWLDVAIGSDTSGSMRSPSSVMGVFGNRPTHGLLDLDGMIPCSRVLDTAAFATRDVDIFDRFNKAWYPLPHIVNANCRPKRLLYPEDYLPYENPEAQRLMDSFVSEMEIFLGVKAHRINLAAFWDEDNPTENAIPLKEFVQDILNPLVWYGFSRELAQFRLDHKRIFHSEPYIDPVIQIACEKGDEITSDDLSRILKKKDLYKQWMEEKVFLSAEDGHLDTIIMYPVGDPLPFYRDTYRLHPSKLTTYDWRDKEDHQACLAGLPAISVPIGQTSYKSRVSGKMERVPASIAIMGARYTDHALTTLLKDMLAARNLPSIVKTGKEAF
ncbi:amidase signature domain-containing protein [Rostrohypoxylon terebratum]|nr:amidase signature domain-containing protein [Rostrohypoxylon terebratum]